MSETITLPGFIDVHVHLREPGNNPSETIENGTRAAMLGGFVMVADMPNNPGNPTHSEQKLRDKLAIAKAGSSIPIGFYSGSQPESDNVGELEAMSKLSLGLKLYGAPTTGNDRDYQAADFKEVVERWHQVAPKKPILFHAGKENLDDMIGLVAYDNGHPLHICHVNDPEDVEWITSGIPEVTKKVDVTCGVTPHHLIKTSHDTHSEGEFSAVKPDLATQVDSEKLMYQVARGYIDAIESDYAPHPIEAKWTAEQGEGRCFGLPGIDQIVPIMLYQAIRKNRISIERLVDAWSTQPAKLLGVGLNNGTGTTWELNDFRIDDQMTSSGAGWTPYAGKIGTGTLQTLRVRGQRIYNANTPVNRKVSLPVTRRGTKI